MGSLASLTALHSDGVLMVIVVGLKDMEPIQRWDTKVIHWTS